MHLIHHKAFRYFTKWIKLNIHQTIPEVSDFSEQHKVAHKGPAWFFDVSVSASVSLLHPQLTPNKLTPWMLGCMCYFCM
jgi:hypothetical protein